MNLKDLIKKDLEIVFNLDEFAENAEYNGNIFPVIFYEKSEYLLDDGYLGYSPAIITKKENIKDIKTGDSLIFRNTTWYVTKKSFKDEFITKLFLSKESSTRF